MVHPIFPLTFDINFESASTVGLNEINSGFMLQTLQRRKKPFSIFFQFYFKRPNTRVLKEYLSEISKFSDKEAVL